MAVVKIPKESLIKLTFSLGLDEHGKEILRKKSLSHVKNDATDDNIYYVAKGISGLQQHTLMDVVRQDNSSLSE
ncbi:DUF1659 domain-containing protein [Tepidibacter formicigenes]|jgi:hypothetical protein|uniref:DUF1659 domain-containing protein n=1 Tax=Tepidibacter formicigenes DSM 15518 TaxID=1123349 RepID=A0A1M6UFQ1_9FIRM|nr:DUF1659 domain-containing protein [Tepidibacter formicigenes]SHK67888.1 Protein of unknown function [Tepidibacter formicigenes DSM 15518]